MAQTYSQYDFATTTSTLERRPSRAARTARRAGAVLNCCARSGDKAKRGEHTPPAPVEDGGGGGVRAGAEVNGHGQPSWRGLPSVWERVKVPSGVDVDESSATPRGGSRGDCVGGSEMHRCRGMARPAPVIMRIGMGDGVVPALAKIYVGHPLGRRVASPCRAAESSEGRSRPCTAGEAGGASGGGAL